MNPLRRFVDYLLRAAYPTLRVYDQSGNCLNVRTAAWRKAPVVRFRAWVSTADRN